MTLVPRLSLFLVGVLLVSTALAVEAGGPSSSADAQQSKPQPTSCAGMTFTDPAGDAKISGAVVAGQPIGPPGDAPKNLDLTGGFFRYAPDASGSNVMTVNLEVVNLDKQIASGFDGAVWTMYYTVDEVVRYARGIMDSAGAATYDYGTFAANSHTREGTTTGALHEGEKGIVSVVVPHATLKLDGKTLTATRGEARARGGGFVFPTDRGPDTGDGKSFRAVPCAEAGSPTQPVPVSPGGAGGSPGGPGGTAPGARSPAAGGPATLGLKVIARGLSAKKATKKKALTISLIATENVTGLSARLLTGTQRGKVVAKGRLSKVVRKAKLRLKVSRKLKKGTYTLTLSGKNSKGQAATVAVQLRLR